MTCHKFQSSLSRTQELVHCTQKSSNGLVTCLGNKIINYVPPLSYSEMLRSPDAGFRGLGLEGLWLGLFVNMWMFIVKLPTRTTRAASCHRT